MKECLKLITERRSITFFDPSKELSDELIREILELSATAPSSYNLQPWEVIVVKDKEKKRELKGICYNQQKVEDASANIIFIANTKAGEEHVDKVLDSWIDLGYLPAENRDMLRGRILEGWMDREKAKKKAIRDTAFLGMNVMLVARSYGLETHPMDGFDEERLRKFLSLEKHKIILMVLAIGYKHPDKKLLPRAYRFKFEEFGKFF